MIGFFTNIKLKRLRNKRDELLNLAHKYSTVDRKKSDNYYMEAKNIEDKIVKITEDTNGNG